MLLELSSVNGGLSPLCYSPLRLTPRLRFAGGEGGFVLKTAFVVGATITLGAIQSGPPLRHFACNNLEAADLGPWSGTSAENTANASVADLDGDGALDIVLAKGRHSPLMNRVLLNNGKGEFVATDLGSRPDRTYSAVLGDLDGDGDIDIVVSNDAPDSKLVYLNDGKGHFRVSGTWGEPEWPTRNATLADLNGDGRLDIIAANRPGPSYVCLNDGRGGFGRACTAIPAESATTIVPADFDRDGFIDLAVPHRDGGQSLIFFNDGHAGFARTKPFGPSISAARVGAAADLNGDGWPDLVVGDEKASTIFVYLNDGHGNLPSSFQLTDRSPVPYAMDIADMNRDGRPDIVIGYIEAASAVFFNDGSGRQYAEVRFGDARGATYGFGLGDVNRDGYPDIAVARTEAQNIVCLSAWNRRTLDR
jgi:hypothetical protein